MADVEITLGFTTAEAQELIPMVRAEAESVAGHPKVKALMAARGFDSVDEMTLRQQAKLVLYAWLMFKQQQHKRREAEITFGEHPEGTDYRIIVRHGDPEARARHEKLGFAEGWGAVTDQLAQVAAR